MPLMDGWETITSLRKLSPDIPVILTSGFNEAQVMAGDHPTLPDAFLSKPYVRKELIAAIGQALSVKN
jgi:CheY-like chemotaxis protein